MLARVVYGNTDLETLSDWNLTQSHNHLVLKQTLNHLAKVAFLASLAKWLSVRLRTKWLWFSIPVAVT